MADNILQVRRDTLANFQAANVVLKNAEPIFLSDEWRVKHGINSPNRVRTGVHAPPFPLREGVPFRALWNCYRHGSQPGATVPASRTNSNKAQFYAFTANLSDYLLHDAAYARIVASGDYEQGSSDPKLMFRLSLGKETGSPTLIQPDGGHYQSLYSVGGAALAENGIEVSYRTFGENALHYDGPFPWNLEMNVMFMGWNAKGQFATSGSANATVRVWGKLYWGPMLGSRGGFHTAAGPIFGGRNETWQPNQNQDWKKDDLVSHHGRAYRSISASDRVPLSGWTEAEYLEHLTEREPGAGKAHRTYWQPMRNELPFQFEETVDLASKGQQLSLLVGGAHQNDTGVARDAWVGSGGGSYETFNAPETAGTVSFGGNNYVSRFFHAKNSSLQPGGAAGAEWERYWKILADDQADKMTIRSSVAYLVGGRPGISDLTPY